MSSSKRAGFHTIQKDFILHNLSIVSYNVDSMYEAKSSHKNSKAHDRRTVLSLEFFQKEWNIVFLQETRSQKGIFYTDHFICFCSGSIDGNYGVETWISKKFPVSCNETCSTLSVTSRNFVEIFSCERSLGLHFQVESISINLVNFYAPQSQLTDEYKCAFWDSLFLNCKKLSKSLNF